MAVDTRYVTHSQWTSYTATQLTYPSGRQVASGYDALYRRNSVTEVSGSTSIAAWQFFGPYRTAELMLGNGLIQTQMNNARTNSAVQTTVPLPAWGDVSSDRLGYDGSGRMITKRYLAGGIDGTTYAYNTPTSIVGYTTAFDPSSNKLFERALHAESRSSLYPGYDSADRLLQYQRGTLATDGGSISSAITLPGTDADRTYALDHLGNWKNTSYTPVGSSPTTEVRRHNLVNEVTKFASTSVLYDHGNNAASGDPLIQAEGNGNIADDGMRTYQYDALNRLSIVKKTSSGNTIATYTYDALGRRILKVVTNGGITGTVANGTYRYISDGQRIVEELDGSNSTTRQFAWGQYIDELIQLETYVNTGSQPLAAGVYYLLSDLLYRSIALTDSSGAIVEAYDTDAYGNTLIYSAAGSGGNWFADDATTSDQPACETIFTGREYDPETLLYFYRARYYHPQLGRFISRDPMLFSDHMNIFGYVGGRPVVAVDPYGWAASPPPSACECPGQFCCAEWTPGWKMMNYTDLQTCFLAQLSKITPNFLVGVLMTGAGGVLDLFAHFTKSGGAPTILLSIIGGGLVADVIIFKAFDLCDDEWCTRLRRADAVAGVLWGVRCTCLDPTPSDPLHEEPPHHIGDRRSGP